MVKRKAELPLLAPACDQRFSYDKDRLKCCLRHMCPDSLTRFPNASEFNFYKAVSDDGARQYRALEIGLVWPVNEAQRAPEKLFVIDRGAYDSGAPEFIAYTEKGRLQHSIVEAIGFVPTGLFASFSRLEGYDMPRAKLNDPLVMSLIQYIFVIRGMRRYYFYPAPHDAPTNIQLATLAEAIDRAAVRTSINGGQSNLPHDCVIGAVQSTPRGPRLFGVDPKLAAMPFTIAIPDRTVAPNANIFNRSRSDSVIPNRAWPNGSNGHQQTPPNDIVSEGATDGETMIAHSTPDQIAPNEFTSGV